MADTAQEKVQFTPGKDAEEHTQNLQGNVSQALGVPQDSVVPPKTSNPQTPMGIDLENVEEDIRAFVPWSTPTSRIARSKEFLKKLLAKIKKKNPGREIRIEEKK